MTPVQLYRNLLRNVRKLPKESQSHYRHYIRQVNTSYDWQLEFEPVNSKTVCKYKRDYSFYCKTRKHWKVQCVYRQCLTHKGHRMLQVKENECMKTHTCHNYNSSSFTTVISLLLNLTRRTKTIYITIFIILNIFLIKWKRLYNVLFLTS